MSANEVVPLMRSEYSELIRTLTFLTERDTDMRLYTRLLAALRETGNRATCVQISFEPYKSPTKRRKARSKP